MDKIMFWKKKKNPADDVAQNLANLIGTSVAGFTPQSPNVEVDLNTELFIRNNVAIAALVIIAGLIRGNQDQQASILKSIEPAYLGAKSFEAYLFSIITQEPRHNQGISLKAVEMRIPEYSQVVYGEPATQKSLEGEYFKWSQILDFELTNEYIAKAVEICRNRAKKEGLLVET